ncbi:MAG: YkvI family membrane protein [Mycobacteriaceae bacterium]
MKEQLKISMAFLGLLVGAGFATGLEVIQYFASFGLTGLWGALLAGVVMAVAGAVILQLGSYFLAEEHYRVFRGIAHPAVSRFMDVVVVLTLFCIGFVMLAGAGSNLEQQFGMPTWIGSLIMTVLVMVTGLLDVDKVSDIIGGLTPLLIIAVIVGFVYTLFNLPASIGDAGDMASLEESPVSPWWLSALNYNGLALLLGVSMSLVIGGNHADLRAAGRGGLLGGVVYTVLLALAAFTLLANIDIVAGDDVPMLTLFDSMHPVMAYAMVFVIFAMIYNTAIGMFYALGKRVTSARPGWYTPVFLALCGAGYAVSFVGFDTLMTYVYPVLGYLGMAMVVVLVGWWLYARRRLAAESGHRDTVRTLTEQREDGDSDFGAEERSELREELDESDAPPGKLEDQVTGEVKDEVGDGDDSRGD